MVKETCFEYLYPTSRRPAQKNVAVLTLTADHGHKALCLTEKPLHVINKLLLNLGMQLTS